MSSRKDQLGFKSRTRVGNYELGKTLGEGSFAKVKFARNVHSAKTVAIKILNRDHLLLHKMVHQIKREISTMKVINHPNVVKLHEVMASRTKIYMVLELLDGGELFDKIAKHGRLKEKEARKYFQQLINAVDYCHSRGVYHRDLKPENLVLDSYGVLKVADFGLSTFSRQVHEDGLFHTACGTPNYVAPEVLTDKGYDGTTIDVWSCGVILFVLMAGYLPFDDSNLSTLYKKIQSASFAVPPWFTSGAKKLIKRILNPNPLTNYLVTERRERPVSMNAFELISGLQGFSLENLFNKEPGVVKRETHFTSQCPANEIISKIEEAAKSLDFNVRKRNYKVRLQGHTSGRKGHLSVATEVFEVAPSFHVVVLRKTGGDTLEFHNFFRSFSSGLKDVVWKCDVIDEDYSRL